MMKKQFSEKMGKFLDGKGFYIALILCLAVIGCSTYYLVHSLRSISVTTQELEAASAPAEIAAEDILESPSVFTEAEGDSNVQEVLAEEDTPAAEAAAPAEVPAEAPVEVPAEPVSAPAEELAKVTTWPIQGSVVTAFSPDALIADQTMGDWRTHEGIDLAAEEGTNVQAVADGTVTAIDNDLLLGIVMTVEHSGGLTSVYGNLGTETLVEVGDKVSAGCVLGQVGNTAAGEAALGNHLHFAMTLNGEPVNPADYLP